MPKGLNQDLIVLSPLSTMESSGDNFHFVFFHAASTSPHQHKDYQTLMRITSRLLPSTNACTLTATPWVAVPQLLDPKLQGSTIGCFQSGPILHAYSNSTRNDRLSSRRKQKLCDPVPNHWPVQSVHRPPCCLNLLVLPLPPGMSIVKHLKATNLSMYYINCLNLSMAIIKSISWLIKWPGLG